MSRITDGADYINALSGIPVISQCGCCENDMSFIWPKRKGIPLPKAELTILCPDCFYDASCKSADDKVYIRGLFIDDSQTDSSGLIDGYEEFNE